MIEMRGACGVKVSLYTDVEMDSFAPEVLSTTPRMLSITTTFGVKLS